jgi:hypothetical protein
LRYEFHGPVADLVREASAMAALLKAGVEAPAPVRAVRHAAADLYVRAITQGSAPTRDELDALCVQVPASDLQRARRIVGSLVRAAGERGMIATPQVWRPRAPHDAATT